MWLLTFRTPACTAVSITWCSCLTECFMCSYKKTKKMID